ncbi:MAG: NAD(P)H:quinone oxidoreductase [Spirochaetales bacterium]|nr:NAD(P)H:quinone oxidoreductase [Spirochaetales bacterium]
MKFAVVFYSTYGHIYEMVKKASEGAKAAGAEVDILKVPETLSPEVIDALGATDAQKAFADLVGAEVDKLPEYDGFIFAFPTRFGNMPAQFKTFLDATGQLWFTGALVGKPFGIITSSATQHSGQESTILTSLVPFIHHGMIYVGLPQTEPLLADITRVGGGSYYGASTISGGDGSRLPDDGEKELAFKLGERVAGVAGKLS